MHKVNREVVRAMSKPDVQQRLRQDGMVSASYDIEEFRKFLEAETVQWKPVAERAALAR